MIFRTPRLPRWWSFIVWEAERESPVAPATLPVQPLPPGARAFLDALDAALSLTDPSELDRARIRRRLDRAFAQRPVPPRFDPHGWRPPDASRLVNRTGPRSESDRAVDRATRIWNRLHPRTPMHRTGWCDKCGHYECECD